MSVRNHYDILGVSKKATEKEIKSAFRKLSMKTHPDVAKNADGEAFKRIAEAHTVLSNKNARWKYDLQLQDRAMWGGRGTTTNDGGFYGGGNMRRPQPRKSALHVLMETASNPRFAIMGVGTFVSIFVLSAMLGGVSSKQPEYHHGNPLVEAWKNPKTGKWEQPAPWDPLYRSLKPKLKLMPRENVRRRNLSNS
jgi:curved DNA-binding protein CbpA